MTLSEEFLAKGIVKFPVNVRRPLYRIHEAVLMTACKYLNLNGAHSLDQLHKYIPTEKLNALRLHIIQQMNQEYWFKEYYFLLAKQALHELVGNELAMQRNINLSIQTPGDDSSLLPVHCDTWSGDSPYEVVLWIPLGDCFGTKSMFFCDKAKDAETQPNISKYKNSEDLYKAIEPHAKFVDVKYGEALIFTQNIMHGNRVNTTNETRWSLNCRFKSLFSPYADKKLGEFFEPVEIKPATKFGMNYQYPKAGDLCA